MPEQSDRGPAIERIDKPALVLLKFAHKPDERARDRMRLAPAASTAGTDPQSVWLGPDRWLLVSDSATPADLISRCNQDLGGVTHHAVDYSSALAVFRISGRNARQLLESGSGVDFRPAKFPVGTCCRTRLAQIAAVVVADAAEGYEIYIDRSYANYLSDWLAASANIYRSYLN